MLTEIFSNPFVYYSSGAIFMFMLGISAGNYATSLVYRLPKGLVIANDPPYCECAKRVYLTPKDLFPLFSWLSTKGKCRYCDIRIPATYTVMEALCGILFIANFVIFGLGQELVLVLSLDVMLITIAALYFKEKRMFTVLIVAVAGLGAVFRTLLDGNIFGFFMGGYMGLMMGIVLWGVEMLLRRQKIPFPAYAVMFALGGWCLGQSMLIPFFVVSFIIACLTFAVGCVSERFKESAWIIGTCGALILALSHL